MALAYKNGANWSDSDCAENSMDCEKSSNWRKFPINYVRMLGIANAFFAEFAEAWQSMLTTLPFFNRPTLKPNLMRVDFGLEPDEEKGVCRLYMNKCPSGDGNTR